MGGRTYIPKLNDALDQGGGIHLGVIRIQGLLIRFGEQVLE